jgi:predicted O-methyltransferase YrrM
MKVDLEGWNYDGPAFAKMVEHTRPKVVIEVGVWKGASLLHMAKLCRDRNLGTVFFAVDVFTGFAGGHPELGGSALIPPTWDATTRYEQFLYNVKASGFDDCVIPVWELSSVGAVVLAAQEVRAELIYIDAGHEEWDAYRDTSAYYPLLAEGGAMFGDDWRGYAGVRNGVRQFAKEMNLTITFDDWKWALRAPWLDPVPIEEREGIDLDNLHEERP